MILVGSGTKPMLVIKPIMNSSVEDVLAFKTCCGLKVTDQDLNDEISHAAMLSGIVDQEGKADLKKWIEMATTERDISREIYLRDSVWPSAALKKLTGGKVEVDDLAAAVPGG